MSHWQAQRKFCNRFEIRRVSVIVPIVNGLLQITEYF
ncbi:hypothetical protein KGM_210168 [Danaus plexippus plexippus]|uniref:Uncharacterized protein n=1 Tax=Danaus plexippus plexippus TaxID=278856 RepID=A0A212EZL7_DANPL|nr:hypothetical protein KGM_210168 [Danaus plexippus plexippus]